MQVHNVILIGLSAGMGSAAIFFAAQARYSLWGNAYRASQVGMAWTVYVFFVSKIYEFGGARAAFLPALGAMPPVATTCELEEFRLLVPWAAGALSGAARGIVCSVHCAVKAPTCTASVASVRQC